MPPKQVRDPTSVDRISDFRISNFLSYCTGGHYAGSRNEISRRQLEQPGAATGGLGGQRIGYPPRGGLLLQRAGSGFRPNGRGVAASPDRIVQLPNLQRTQTGPKDKNAHGNRNPLGSQS